MLPCLHTFCEACIGALPTQTCPTCSTAFHMSEEGVSSFPRDTIADSLSAVARLQHAATEPDGIVCGVCDGPVRPVTHRCVECDEFYCADHNRMVHKMKSHATHNVATLDEVLSGSIAALQSHTPRLCAVHATVAANELTLFCLDCNLMICTNCSLEGHRTHTLEFCVEVLAGQKERVVAVAVRARGIAEILSQAVAAIDALDHLVEENKAYCEEKVLCIAYFDV